MKTVLLFGCVLLVAATGCKRESPTEPTSFAFPGQSPGSPAPAVSEWAKVKVGATGEVFVNKKQMSQEEFSSECARLKKTGGAILIFIDAPNHTLNPAQAKMAQKIVGTGLPVKMVIKESGLD